MMEPRVIASPSGKYVLEIQQVATRPGCWNYSKGTVRVGDAVVAEVDRNYSAFPYLFVEGHPNGHDYLVCGANYQGQTVIELDTGRRRDFLPEEAGRGHGFCWTVYTWNPEWQVLVVDGCIWACPYEYRIYGFSDPMSGWPQLRTDNEDDLWHADGRLPELFPDGRLTTFELGWNDDSEENDSDEEKPRPVVATHTYRRDGDRLLLVESWVDPEEARRREEARREREAWELAWNSYKETDPLYRRAKERVAAEWPKADGSVSIGQCYAGWCPHFTGSDARVCRGLTRSPSLVISLEWGRREAPVRLGVWRGASAENKEEAIWFPHSVEGMDAALDMAKALAP